VNAELNQQLLETAEVVQDKAQELGHGKSMSAKEEILGIVQDMDHALEQEEKAVNSTDPNGKDLRFSFFFFIFSSFQIGFSFWAKKYVAAQKTLVGKIQDLQDIDLEHKEVLIDAVNDISK
jgi:hypothetical protein